jgi:hypothetical protein
VTLPERPWSNYTREELLSHIESKHNAMLLAAKGNASLRAELETLRSVHQDAQAELVKLEHELRKYEPSDGVMAQLLGLNECIREAARIFELLTLGKPGFERLTLADLLDWLALPAVKAAAKT